MILYHKLYYLSLLDYLSQVLQLILLVLIILLNIFSIVLYLMNINLLIYQQLDVNHLSLYQLIIEPKTPLYSFVKSGYKRFATALTPSGGTAFPICTNCLFFFPSKIKSSGKDCKRAISLAVKTRGSLGCKLTPP